MTHDSLQLAQVALVKYREHYVQWLLREFGRDTSPGLDKIDAALDEVEEAFLAE